jgi:hypothetical protein
VPGEQRAQGEVQLSSQKKGDCIGHDRLPPVVGEAGKETELRQAGHPARGGEAPRAGDLGEESVSDGSDLRA